MTRSGHNVKSSFQRDVARGAHEGTAAVLRRLPSCWSALNRACTTDYPERHSATKIRTLCSSVTSVVNRTWSPQRGLPQRTQRGTEVRAFMPDESPPENLLGNEWFLFI